MAGYASAKGYGLVDYSLYMPDKWFDAGYAELRKKCDVPSSIRFKTKNEMLLEMIWSTVRSGLYPAKYVGVDAGFGSDAAFLDGLPENLVYFADIRSNQIIFTDKPETFVPMYSGRGRRPTKPKADAVPISVKKAIEKSDEPWERVVLGIGAKGPIIAEDKILRVVEIRNDLPGNGVWLYARKLDDGTIKYALCNAPADAVKKDIRKPALMRWSIEQCFKECKDYLGMDHYESRGWDAWHRHILMTFIAHLFIVKLRIEFSRKPSAPNATPFIDKPVSLDDYLDAHMQMVSNRVISHPDIFTAPMFPQQFMTIGLVQKLVNATFPKVGLIVEEVDYLLYKAANAFASHSLTTVKNAMLARN
jgi:SRSO17 transposase